MKWLTAEQFAALAGITVTNASETMQRCCDGNAWRGFQLAVSQKIGRGRGGKTLTVNPDSLPPDLRRDYYLQQAQGDNQNFKGLKGKPLDVALHRYSVIAEAVNMKPGTQLRREAVKRALERLYADPYKAKKLTQAMVYDWMRRYKDQGMPGLAPKGRADKGNKRTLLSRTFDDLANGIDRAVAETIAEGVKGAIASYWTSGVPGWRQIAELAEVRLSELCKEQGHFSLKTWPDSPHKQARTPFLNRRTVETYRDYQMVHTADNDAKRFFDCFLPRIGRTRDGLRPLDLVIGDVHPIDIMLRREDGSEVYPRAIAWQDVATGRVFFTLILLAKREGVNQLHVGQSFASMCEAWGFPNCLYLDNGSEYNWVDMMGGFLTLANLTKLDIRFLSDLPPEQRHIVRSRPYNAPAKSIEGLFSVLEQNYLSQIEGWTAGDRTRKKTQNLGQEPRHFSGTWADFHEALDIALERYHKRPQDTFGKKSPNQVLADFIDNGWQKVDVSQDAMLFAFAEEETRKADRGRVHCNGQDHYHDALLPHTGKRLKVRIPRHDTSLVFVFGPDDKLLCAAPIDKPYGYLDPEGAKEQSRRAGVMRRYIASLKANTSRLDLVHEMAKWNRTQPDAPIIPTGSKVGLSSDVMQMIDASRAAEAERIQQVVEHQSEPANPLSQWSRADERDPYLDAVGFSKE